MGPWLTFRDSIMALPSIWSRLSEVGYRNRALQCEPGARERAPAIPDPDPISLCESTGWVPI